MLRERLVVASAFTTLAAGLLGVALCLYMLIRRLLS